jgi:hypothetical protein
MNVDRDLFLQSVRVRPRKIILLLLAGSKLSAVVQYALILTAVFVAVLTIAQG